MADSFPSAPGAEPGSFPCGIESQDTAHKSTLLFGRYRALRELGRGGMGVVLLARDEKLGQPVAIKIVPEHVLQDTEAIDTLRKEVLRGMALTHPGIARTNHFEQDDKGAAIVMEFVEGRTLAQLMKEQPGSCFDVEQIQPWLVQVATALDYAHYDARLAHRDLKPGNIMVTPSGRVKVADFGLASALGDSQSQISIRADGAGTPQYMSPQQFSGEAGNRLDDVYALGATIYALLTGKPPFFKGNVSAILWQAVNVVPPSMTERRTELGITGKAPIPAMWEETIATCLAKDPEQRPQDAGKVLALLHSQPPLEATAYIDDVPPALFDETSNQASEMGVLRAVANDHRKWAIVFAVLATVALAAAVACVVLWISAERKLNAVRDHATMLREDAAMLNEPHREATTNLTAATPTPTPKAPPAAVSTIEQPAHATPPPTETESEAGRARRESFLEKLPALPPPPPQH